MQERALLPDLAVQVLTEWRKLLAGQVDLARVARLVGPKLKDIAWRSVRRAVDRVRRRSTADAEHADVPASLRDMAERGVDTFLLVAERDPGVDYVDVHFPACTCAR